MTSPASPEPVTLTAADGYRLAATRFHPPESSRGHLVVAGATGVRQDFYRRFAEHASRRGFSTLTLDYRGIGKSRPESLKGFQASVLDWARLDVAAAVDAMSSDSVPLFMVGHSFGGHALGLLPNHRRISRFYVFATGSGWYGFMPLAERLRVRLMWSAVHPLFVRWKGYAPMAALGVCEDLPVGVYEHWRRWCNLPRYFLDDPAMAGIAEKMAEVRTPITAANSFDDAWVPPRSRDAFIQGYRNAPLTTVDIDPREIGAAIGHMGYFRQSAQPLWDKALDWFSAHDQGPTS